MYKVTYVVREKDTGKKFHTSCHVLLDIEGASHAAPAAAERKLRWPSTNKTSKLFIPQKQVKIKTSQIHFTEQIIIPWHKKIFWMQKIIKFKIISKAENTWDDTRNKQFPLFRIKFLKRSNRTQAIDQFSSYLFMSTKDEETRLSFNLCFCFFFSRKKKLIEPAN